MSKKEAWHRIDFDDIFSGRSLARLRELIASVVGEQNNLTGNNNGGGGGTTNVAQMSVSPETNISASGYPGDDFTTHSLTYTLTNTGTVAVAWSVSHVASWVTISAASGTLAVGASTTVTVSVNSGASLLSAGQRIDFIDFYGDAA